MINRHFKARLDAEMLNHLQVIVTWLADHGRERPPVGRGRRPVPTPSDAVRFAIRRAADAIRRHRTKRLGATGGK